MTAPPETQTTTGTPHEQAIHVRTGGHPGAAPRFLCVACVSAVCRAVARESKRAMRTLTGTLSLAGRCAGVVVAALALSGCLESADVTFHEPGVYKGAADPLLGNTDEAALQARLRGQTDR